MAGRPAAACSQGDANSKERCRPSPRRAAGRRQSVATSRLLCCAAVRAAFAGAAGACHMQGSHERCKHWPRSRAVSGSVLRAKCALPASAERRSVGPHRQQPCGHAVETVARGCLSRFRACQGRASNCVASATKRLRVRRITLARHVHDDACRQGLSRWRRRTTCQQRRTPRKHTTSGGARALHGGSGARALDGSGALCWRVCGAAPRLPVSGARRRQSARERNGTRSNAPRTQRRSGCSAARTLAGRVPCGDAQEGQQVRPCPAIARCAAG